MDTAWRYHCTSYTQVRMKILIIYDQSGPKYHRLMLPIVYMPGIEIVTSPEITEDLCKDIDLLFFNRMIPNNSINNITGWRKQYGFKIVVDFDDHWELEPDHYLYNTYKATQASDFMRAWIGEADAVTVTHERLANEVMPLNSNVHVLPNSIPREGQFLTPKQPKPVIVDRKEKVPPLELTRLFWAGGVTHEKDIELLRYPIRELRGLPIQMVMGGYSKTKVYHKMRNDFTNYGKLPHDLIEGLPVHEYYYMYSKCDVALVPLTETKFNSHKSNLKILEAANIGANVIVSNVHPYKDIPYVNYVETPADWGKWVRWILDNPDEAKEQALQLQQYCSERFSFTEINKTRKRLFDSLCTPTTAKPLSNTETIIQPG